MTEQSHREIEPAAKLQRVMRMQEDGREFFQGVASSDIRAGDIVIVACGSDTADVHGIRLEDEDAAEQWSRLSDVPANEIREILDQEIAAQERGH